MKMGSRKILHVITGLGRGGAEKLLVRTVLELRKRGVASVVAYFKDSGPAARELGRAGIETVKLPAPVCLLPLAVPRLKTVIAECRVGLIHTHLARADVAGILAAMAASLPCVSTRHNIKEPWDWNPLFRFPYAALLNRCVSVIAVSSAAKSYAVWLGVRASKIIVVLNGTEMPELPARKPEGHPLTVGAAGRLEAFKEFSVFLRAAAKVAEDSGDVRFLIAGDGRQREYLARLGEKLGIAQRVKFEGWFDDMRSFYSNVDVAVAPCPQEGLGLAAIEALSYGIPVVGFDSGGLKEVVEHGKSGYLVPPGDIQAMSQRIISLLSDGPGRQRMGSHARQRAGEVFSMPGMMEELIAVYEKFS